MTKRYRLDYDSAVDEDYKDDGHGPTDRDGDGPAALIRGGMVGRNSSCRYSPSWTQCAPGPQGRACAAAGDPPALGEARWLRRPGRAVLDRPRGHSGGGPAWDGGRHMDPKKPEGNRMTSATATYADPFASSATTKSGGSSEVPPGGAYPAVLVGVIDLGTTEEEYEGKKRDQRKILLIWELCQEHDAKGVTFKVWQDFPFPEKMTPKNPLRKLLESWTNTTYGEDQPVLVLPFMNKPCQIAITEGKSAKGNKFVKVTGVQQPMKGITMPPATVEPFMWSFHGQDPKNDPVFPIEGTHPHLWTTHHRRDQGFPRMGQARPLLKERRGRAPGAKNKRITPAACRLIPRREFVGRRAHHRGSTPMGGSSCVLSSTCGGRPAHTPQATNRRCRLRRGRWAGRARRTGTRSVAPSRY